MSDIPSTVDDTMDTDDSDYQISEFEADLMSGVVEDYEGDMDVDDHPREVLMETPVATGLPEHGTSELGAPSSGAAAGADENTLMRNRHGISVQLQRTTGPQTRRTVNGPAGPTVLLNGPAIPTSPNQALNGDDYPGLDVSAHSVAEAAGQPFRAIVNIEERFRLRGGQGVLIGVMVGHHRQVDNDLRGVPFYTIWRRDDGTIHGEYHIAALTNITRSERGRELSINWFTMPPQRDVQGAIRPGEDGFHLGGSWTAPFGTITIIVRRIRTRLTPNWSPDGADRDLRLQHDRVMRSRGRPMATRLSWVQQWGQVHIYNILNTGRRDAQSRLPESSGHANEGPSDQRVLRRRGAPQRPTGDTQNAATGSDDELEEQFASVTARLTEEQDALETMNRALRPDRPVDDAVMERRYRQAGQIARLSIDRRGLLSRLLNRRGINRPAQATIRELEEDLTDRIHELEARIQLRYHIASTEGRPLTPDENRQNAADEDELLNCQQQREEVRRLLS